MVLKGAKKREYQREYMRKRRMVEGLEGLNEVEIYVIGKRYEPGQRVRVMGSNKIMVIPKVDAEGYVIPDY